MQACGKPAPSTELLRCQQACAWSSLLSHQELHTAAACSHPAPAASQALRRRLDGQASSLLPILSRSVAATLANLPASLLQAGSVPSCPSASLHAHSGSQAHAPHVNEDCVHAGSALPLFTAGVCCPFEPGSLQIHAETQMSQICG